MYGRRLSSLLSPRVRLWYRRQRARHLVDRARDLEVWAAPHSRYERAALTWVEKRELRRMAARLRTLAARLEALPPEPDPPDPPAPVDVDLDALEILIKRR